MGNFFYQLIYWDKIWNLEGYIFEKFFATLKFWDKSSFFRARDHLPCAHWDETGFNNQTHRCWITTE